MSYDYIFSQHRKDRDYPERTHKLRVLRTVLEGTFYDVLRHDWAVEKNQAGEYIPISERRPSVRYPLPALLVEQSASMLFGEGRFPRIHCDDETTENALEAVAKAANMQQTLMEAVQHGAVGSVALLLKVLDKRFYIEVLDSEFLTPVFDHRRPDVLIKLTERYKVHGEALEALGYSVPDAKKFYWFRREWTSTQEIYYVPVEAKATGFTKGEEPPQWTVDAERTTTHNLGFVPAVWVKNLPGGSGVDGMCSFERALPMVVEMDYQLSQVGRGLKYSQDPTLIIKEPAHGQNEIVKGTGVLTVDASGDAKLLEVSGNASAAVLEYVETLRKFALEVLHGNRGNPDKISAVQSGKALEVLNQALVWLCERLRITYGENGYKRILDMMVAMARKLPVEKLKAIPENIEITLMWPRWYEPTAHEIQATVTALAEAVEKKLMTQRDAVKIIAQLFELNPADAEQRLAEINAGGKTSDDKTDEAA